MTLTQYELIPFLCQYSKLTDFKLSSKNTIAMEMLIEIEIDRTALEWHSKPGAIYLNRHDHALIALHEIKNIPVGVMGGLPSDHFLLTDGQELDYENDMEISV